MEATCRRWKLCNLNTNKKLKEGLSAYLASPRFRKGEIKMINKKAYTLINGLLKVVDEVDM